MQTTYDNTIVCRNTESCWRRGCRNIGCIREHNSKELARRRIRERPDSGWDNPLVDSTPARIYLNVLQSRGVSLKALIWATGLSKASLHRIIIGQVKHIQRQRFLKIMAIDSSEFAINTRTIAARKSRAS